MYHTIVLTGKCVYETAYNNGSTAQCLQLAAYFALYKKHLWTCSLPRYRESANPCCFGPPCQVKPSRAMPASQIIAQPHAALLLSFLCHICCCCFGLNYCFGCSSTFRIHPLASLFMAAENSCQCENSLISTLDASSKETFSVCKLQQPAFARAVNDPMISWSVVL